MDYKINKNDDDMCMFQNGVQRLLCSFLCSLFCCFLLVCEADFFVLVEITTMVVVALYPHPGISQVYTHLYESYTNECACVS